MKTIHFKNGKTLEISIKVANIIRNKITADSCRDFQCFSDEKTSDVVIIVNLRDVSFIE